MLERARAVLATGESGYVAVFVALCLPLFVGMAALGVDVAYWHSEGARLQKTADDAALAGVPYLPGAFTTASDVAIQNAKLNGYQDGTAGVTVTPEQVDNRPTRLRVTISSEVDNFFGSIFGRPTTVVTRTAVADFAGPVPMGSPCNTFGNDDMAPLSDQGNCDSNDGKYWLNIAGPDMNKARGDAYASKWCGAPDISGGPIDDCPSGWNRQGGNADFTDQGYTFIVRVKAAGTLNLEAYDGGYVGTGDTCTDGKFEDSTAATNPYYVVRPAQYQKTNNVWCSGDSIQDGNTTSDIQGSGVVVRTVFTVRNPSPNPFDPLQGTVISNCGRDLAGWNGRDDNFNLRNGLTQGNGAYSLALAQTFHRWQNLCSAGIPVQPGDYSIQVQTPSGGSQNRLALRATHSAGNDEVSIFAAGRVSLYLNTPANTTSNFNMVRLDSSTARHTLVVRFFDFGDVGSGTVDVTLKTPDSSTLTGSNFSGCVAVGPTSGATGSTCSVNGMRASTHGGRWQEVRIPIPSDYRCNAEADQSKCWVVASIRNNGGNPSDTTTWQASLIGDPVRIVE